ncbi:hypothetical protein TNCV_992471 [Trichonephila clavipes]|nr:hypothetical protein TNCV_992471 [Trichonephila clavipes]
MSSSLNPSENPPCRGADSCEMCRSSMSSRCLECWNLGEGMCQLRRSPHSLTMGSKLRVVFQPTHVELLDVFERNNTFFAGSDRSNRIAMVTRGLRCFCLLFVPLKTHRVEGLMCVEPVEVSSSNVGVM